MNKIQRLIGVTILSAGLSVFGCASSGGSDDETGDDGGEVGTDENGSTEAIDDGCGLNLAEYVPAVETGEGCGFSEDTKGKIKGKHIANFGVELISTQEVQLPGKCETKEFHDKYYLHSNCGQKKAVWIILATGW